MAVRLWQAIYDQTDDGRNALITRAGHAVLAHKSRECKVCVNENREGLAAAPEVAIADIARVERELGTGVGGKPRTMFRPAKKMGATGIRQVVRWARSAPGKFTLDDGTGPSGTETGCDGGFCAS